MSAKGPRRVGSGTGQSCDFERTRGSEQARAAISSDGTAFSSAQQAPAAISSDSTASSSAPPTPGRPFWSQHKTKSYLWEIQCINGTNI